MYGRRASDHGPDFQLAGFDPEHHAQASLRDDVAARWLQLGRRRSKLGVLDANRREGGPHSQHAPGAQSAGCVFLIARGMGWAGLVGLALASTGLELCSGTGFGLGPARERVRESYPVMHGAQPSTAALAAAGRAEKEGKRAGSACVFGAQRGKLQRLVLVCHVLDGRASQYYIVPTVHSAGAATSENDNRE